jgi:hypothetical protein
LRRAAQRDVEPSGHSRSDRSHRPRPRRPKYPQCAAMDVIAEMTEIRDERLAIRRGHPCQTYSFSAIFQT